MRRSERVVVSTPTVDLVFDATCPNVNEARTLLRTGLARAGLPMKWHEWHRDGTETPAAYRGLGSPTILVNSRDVSEGGTVEHGDCCRLYEYQGQLRGVPSLPVFMNALQAERSRA